jgi:hypothetical protein
MLNDMLDGSESSQVTKGGAKRRSIFRKRTAWSECHRSMKRNNELEVLQIFPLKRPWQQDLSRRSTLNGGGFVSPGFVMD